VAGGTTLCCDVCPRNCVGDSLCWTLIYSRHGLLLLPLTLRLPSASDAGTSVRHVTCSASLGGVRCRRWVGPPFDWLLVGHSVVQFDVMWMAHGSACWDTNWLSDGDVALLPACVCCQLVK
jgi:hypothetical protein